METLSIVNQGDYDDFRVNVCGRVDMTDNRMLNTKKPYVVNLSHVECIIGEWNKDKGEYGVRIYFVSGKDVWIGGIVARDLLGKCYLSGGGDAELVGKFDDRVEAGMPTV